MIGVLCHVSATVFLSFIGHTWQCLSEYTQRLPVAYTILTSSFVTIQHCVLSLVIDWQCLLQYTQRLQNRPLLLHIVVLWQYK